MPRCIAFSTDSWLKFDSFYADTTHQFKRMILSRSFEKGNFLIFQEVSETCLSDVFCTKLFCLEFLDFDVNVTLSLVRFLADGEYFNSELKLKLSVRTLSSDFGVKTTKIY